MASIKEWAAQNQPDIWMWGGLGILACNMPVTGYSAIQAYKKVEKKKEELGVKKLGVKDTVKCVWKSTLLPIASYGAGAACVIRGNHVQGKAIAALTAVAAVAQDSLRDIQESIKETVSEEVYSEVKEKAAQKKVDKNPPGEKTAKVVRQTSSAAEPYTSNGEKVLFMEPTTGRYFMANEDIVARAIAELNTAILTYDHQSLNDFYDFLNLDPTSIGDDLGWSSTDGKVFVSYSSTLVNGAKPCVVIDFGTTPPRYAYRERY